MNYSETINYIHSVPRFSRVLGNDALKKLLACLGNPQNGLKYIHIAGTNGKGSAAAMCESILRRAGYKTGLFTSPYIEVYNERIRVNGENIPNDALSRIVTRIRAVMEENGAFVSEFALGTAAAFVYFAEQNCDYVILEVGMGGLLDATNVIEKAEATAIMSISIDHTQYLGGTIEKIAREKCGIIKENAAVAVYMPQDKRALDVIEKTCAEKRAQLVLCGEPTEEGNGFSYKGRRYELSLKGSYQPYNAAVAVEIAKLLIERGAHISDDDIYGGLLSTSWPARFEFLSDRLIIDGSHNPDGMRTLAESLLRLKKKVTLVLAMLEDKEHGECLSYISGFADRIVATEIDAPRCLDAYAAAAETMRPALIETSLEKAINGALAFDDNVVCVCGSLYAAGSARRLYNEGKIRV